MNLVITIIVIISVLFFLGALKYLLALTRPGVYPPKQVLRKRSVSLAGAGGVMLIVAIILSNF